ncbi:DUF3862 domain-containing protein [Streptococcus gallolyticus subsp. gallolyticus]|uniref:DUF3862 domain-containing protein n=1 Tax=Streptococcus gallolyticus TaxID=315405 RepID=UPI002284F69D|nr:DUF3862 domain-containing protein [Streptococcus gallolyticus]MCY7157475.1 DUF3862 domain-containing protein [Streptococcus gallolyticus subsp. gallolyticus]
MKKVGLLGLTLLSVVALSACTSNSTSSKNSDSSASQSTTTSSSKTVVNTELRNKFDAITVGDIINSGEGGSTIDEVKSSLGEPSSTTTSDDGGITTDTLNWYDGETSISISFANNRVVNKAITGFLFDRDDTITLSDFNNLQTGTSYNDVYTSWGEPDGYSESLIMGSKSVSAYWYSNIKGEDSTANIFLMFTDDSLSTKSQTGLTD